MECRRRSRAGMICSATELDVSKLGATRCTFGQSIEFSLHVDHAKTLLSAYLTGPLGPGFPLSSHSQVGTTEKLGHYQLLSNYPTCIEA